MPKIILIFIFLLGVAPAGAASLSQKNFWHEEVPWKALEVVLSSRCQTYTPDNNNACSLTSGALVKELRLDIGDRPFPPLEYAEVVFKPELLNILNSPTTNRILDFWIQELEFMKYSRQWTTSLFDRTVSFLGSEDETLRYFAILLQDVSSSPKIFNWISEYFNEQNQPATDISKLVKVIDLIKKVPAVNSNIFYPSVLWSSSHNFFRSTFYHFYVNAYLYKKLSVQAPRSYASTVVFLFNYFYENFQENGKFKAVLMDPRKIKDSRNLNDIRLAYLAINWVDNKENRPLLYAQNGFLNLEHTRFKYTLSTWIERLLRME